MRGNVAYVLIALLVLAVVAAIAFMGTKTTQGPGEEIGVSEEEINQLGSYEELNLPADITTEENIPNPEETIVVDENDVTLDLPEDI